MHAHRLARIALLASAVLLVLALAGQLAHAASPFRAPHPLPNYTHPVAFADRLAARDRVLEVFAAIDAATTDPELRAELRRVCRRESACNWIEPVTIHAGDAAGGRARWRMAVRAGRLDPSSCAAHRLGDPAAWSTYGPLGIAAAWTVPHAGRCVGPEVLDDPRVAVRAAVGWIHSLCRRQRACTCEDRTRWWVGPLVFADRSPWAQLATVERQCGDLPWWRWAGALVLELGELASGRR